ncbi:MAG: hypothetical protein PVJ64_16285 [Gemmatimonadales bacterium]|jgi:hypothetical protein
MRREEALGRRLVLIPLLTTLLGGCGSLARRVDIDVDPESDRACIDSRSRAISVAILGSPEIDVRRIDLHSAELLLPQLGAGGRPDPARARYEYSNLDAYEDVVLPFLLAYDTFGTRIGPATLTAELDDGTAIRGTEDVCVVQDRRRP